MQIHIVIDDDDRDQCPDKPLTINVYAGELDMDGGGDALDTFESAGTGFALRQALATISAGEWDAHIVTAYEQDGGEVR